MRHRPFTATENRRFRAEARRILREEPRLPPHIRVAYRRMLRERWKRPKSEPKPTAVPRVRDWLRHNEDRDVVS